MQWEDEGLILHVGKYSESSAIVTLFAARHGLYRSVVKGGLSKRQRGVLQPGNIVAARWNARLSEHMGNLTIEPVVPVAALAMRDALCLAAANSLCGLLIATQAERDPHQGLYAAARALLVDLAEGRDFIRDYIRFELTLLQEGGFGLDLSACAATGNRDELIYVSPKSGRAVSRDAGAPYAEKLLRLPPFLRSCDVDAPPSQAEILDGLRLTAYFLEHWLLDPHERRLPAARDRLMERIAGRSKLLQD